MRKEARASHVIACAGVGVATMASAVTTGVDPSASASWLVVLWCSSLAACALLASMRTRVARACAAWALVVPLLTLAANAAYVPLNVLAATVFLLGAAGLLGVRMYIPDIIVTDQDVERLSSLIDTLPPEQRVAARGLEAELARADVVALSAIPPDVVTMNSRVVFEDEDSGKRYEAVLGYPRNVDANGGTISILAPVGTALLGLRAGQCIDWLMPSGRCKRIRVLEVVYQPEAAGDFHL